MWLVLGLLLPQLKLKNESPLLSSIFIELSTIGLEFFDLMRLLLRLANVDVCLLHVEQRNDIIKTVSNQYFDSDESLL